MKLTDTFVKRKQGNGKAQKFADGGGLFLYISPKGTKSWRMAYRHLGKHKLLVIGPYPAISLKEARERREAAKKMLVDNIDPSTAKREAKNEAINAAKNSFEAIACEWLNKQSAVLAPGTKQVIGSRMERYLFQYIGKRPIKSITAQELLAVMRRVENKHIQVAHRLLRECGRVFRYAIATGRAERDVAADLRGALAAEPRNHYATVTDPQALGRLLCSLDAYHGTFPVRCGLRLAPLLFVRGGELARAEWSEFDFQTKEWRIPAHKMKMKQVHIVPLARQALKILRELHEFSGNTRFLFPGQNETEKRINRSTFTLALRRMGYTSEELTFHSFRSIATTFLNEQGYNSDWVERQLAHCERNNVRAAYNYAQYLPERRKMMQKWADYLTKLKEKTQQEAASPSIAPAALPEAAGSVKGKALRAAPRP